MGLNDNDHAGKRMAARLLSRFGCIPADAPDGPALAKFDPMGLGGAIQQEVNRARIYGWSKITIHMDLADAVELASYLKGER